MELEMETANSQLNSLLQIEEMMFSRYRELIQTQIQRLHETRLRTEPPHPATNYIETPDHNITDVCTQTSSVDSLSRGIIGRQLKSNVFSIALYLIIYLEELSHVEHNWRRKLMPSSDLLKRQEANTSLDVMIGMASDWTVTMENECRWFADMLFQTEESVTNMTREVRISEICIVTYEIIAMLNTHFDVLLEHHRDLRGTGGGIILDKIAVTLGCVCSVLQSVIIKLTERSSEEHVSDSSLDTTASFLYESDYTHDGQKSMGLFAVTFPTGSHSAYESRSQQLISPGRSAFSDIAIPEFLRRERQTTLGENWKSLPEQDSLREQTCESHAPQVKETETKIPRSCSKNVAQESIGSKDSSSTAPGMGEKLQALDLQNNFRGNGSTQSNSISGLIPMDASSGGYPAVVTQSDDVKQCHITSVRASPSVLLSVNLKHSSTRSVKSLSPEPFGKDISECELSNSSALPKFISDSADISGLFKSRSNSCDVETEDDTIPRREYGYCTNNSTSLCSRLNQISAIPGQADVSSDLDNQTSVLGVCRSICSTGSQGLLKNNLLKSDMPIAESRTFEVPDEFEYRYDSYVADNVPRNTIQSSQYFDSASSSELSFPGTTKTIESCGCQSTCSHLTESGETGMHLQMALMVIFGALAFIVLLNCWSYLFDNARAPNFYSVFENVHKFTTLTHYGMPAV